MSKGIKYTPRSIKCCTTCKYLIPPEEPLEVSIDGALWHYGTFVQLLGCYQCYKAGRRWNTLNNEPPQDRCSMHKFKDKSLIR